MVQLTDSQGNVVRQYDYDAFGVEIDPDPDDTNPFRYCRFPDHMTEAAILKAIEEAYKHAEKAGELRYIWQNGTEQVKQFFYGGWSGGTIEFWFNYTTKTIETAWPK